MTTPTPTIQSSGGLLAYQRKLLTDPSLLIAFVKSRRIGGTSTFALREAFRASGFTPNADGQMVEATPVDQHIISASEQQAIGHLSECRKWLGFLTEFHGGPRIVKPDNAFQITLESGVALRAYAANPRTLRGGEGDVTLDEYGVMPHDAEIWEAAYAIRKATLRNPREYELRVTGTPNGDANKFYRIINTDEGREFSRHRITIYEAHAQGFPIDIEKTRSEIGEADMFEQEFNCAFLSASSRYIPADLYDRAIWFDGAPLERFEDGYAGYDVARKAGGDRSACVELERVGDVLWVVKVESRQGVPWADQEAWVADVLERRRRIAIDVSGLGMQFGERLTNRFHSSRVEGVEFTGRTKEALATGLKLAFERGRLRVPDNLDLRRDVLALRREVTAAGNTRFDAERNQHGHGDLAWALALAVHAAGGASQSDGMTKAPRIDVLAPFFARPSGRIVQR